MNHSNQPLPPPASTHDMVELLDRWCHGDQDAANLVIEYVRVPLLLVFRRSLSKYKHLQPTFRESDVFQEVCITAMQKIRDEDQAFSSLEEFVAWPTRIGENKIQHAHRGSRTEKRNSSLEQAIPEFLQGHDPSAELIADADEMWAGWLRHLTPLERQVMTLYKDGLSYLEIGEVVGSSDRSIRRWIDVFRELHIGCST